MIYDVAKLSALEIYDLMVAAIVPRPIAFVSTLSADGVANLAPFSFFCPGGASPPSLVFSVTLNGRGEPKDTLRNIEATEEFVVNTLNRAMTDGMNQTSLALPSNESEWPLSGFTPAECLHVKPERVAESPASFECRLAQVVPHGDGPSAARYVIGEILAIHVREDVPLDTISRLGGSRYLDMATGEIFHVDRPTWTQNG